MSISELKDEFQERLARFVWDQWGQMGVAANVTRHDTWAADPEALLLVTFEVGRGEPRLLEEVLDWMVVNERLISVQRLRNLAGDDEDRRLVEAVLGWMGQNRRRPRLGARQETLWGDRAPQPFFRDSRLPVGDPDPAFLAQGFLKPATERSGKSRGPDLSLPINLAFRLRLLLGVSVRAEVVRALLTVDAPWVNAQTLTAMTAYTKRNVQEAAAALSAAGEATAGTINNENRYQTSRSRWAGFLKIGDLPEHQNWPQLSRMWRLVLRWLADPANEGLSPYMLASGTRTLKGSIESDFFLGGIPSGVADPTTDLAGLREFVEGLTRGFV